MDAWEYENVPRPVRRTKSYNLMALLSPKRSGSFDVARAQETGMFEATRRRPDRPDFEKEHGEFRQQPTTSLMAKMRDAFEKASQKMRPGHGLQRRSMVIEHPNPKWMVGRETETALRYLREVIRSGKREVLGNSASAVLNSVASSCNHKDSQLQDALVGLLQFVDQYVGENSTLQIDKVEGARLVDILEKEIASSKQRPTPPESEESLGYEVQEPDDLDGFTGSISKNPEDPEIEKLLSQLNLRAVAKFEPKFPEIDPESDDDTAVTVDERKEERAEKHGQKTCEEEVEKLADGTEVRRKKTRTVNLSQSSKQVTISTRGGNVPSVSRRFTDGTHSMNDDTDFETTDFFGSSPFARMKMNRPNLLEGDEVKSIGNGAEPGQSTKTKTVEATSEVMQSVAQKTQRNGRLLAENAAHQIDSTELNAKMIDTFEGKKLLDRKGGGTYQESTIIRSGLPGLTKSPTETPVKKHVVEYMQTFGNENDSPKDEFLRGTTLASYVLLNDNLRLHEEQFRKKLTFEFSSKGVSTAPADFTHLSELLQGCSDFTRVKLPTKFEDGIEVSAQRSITFPEKKAIGAPPCILESFDVTDYLVLRAKDDAARPGEVRGGPADALIVYATQPNVPLMYQEAFLATYRTFCSSIDLINKLVTRYIFMSFGPELASQKAARLTFTVVVRIVDELSPFELTKELVTVVTAFVYKLIRDGNLQLARLLRQRLLDRIEASVLAKALMKSPIEKMKRNDTLLDCRSLAVAQQLTCLDQKLFQSIDIVELLWWSQEQDEKKCPNLVAFTAQFNKMSYWVRTMVLSPKDHREREKYMNKFIKIMKQLRRIHNFNSYLAILSALDSGPVRRLEWSKTCVEQLKEHAKIMDSRLSFKAYRGALQEASPPCIPYVGLILQDLTFVHVGNPNLLPPDQVGGRTGFLNFTKKWQQYAILNSIRKFKQWSYSFTKEDRILSILNNFPSLTENETWELSESIKPRQRKNP